MGLLKWFTDFLEANKGDDGSVSLNTTRVERDSTAGTLWQMKAALHAVYTRYSAMLSKCEFKTYINGKEVKGYNYYLFNLAPNNNQTKSQFLDQVMRRLILSPTHDCLIVAIPDKTGNDRLYVATDFKIGESQIREAMFYDVSINTIGDTEIQLYRTFRGREAIYIKLTSSDVEELFMEMKQMYVDLIENDKKAGTYRQKYALSLDQTAEAQPDFEEHMQYLLDEQFKAFIEGDNSVIPLYAGMKLDQTSAGADLGQNASVADKAVHNATDEVYCKVGTLFNIPNSIMLGKYEADDIEQFLLWCLDPIANMVSEAINKSYYGPEIVRTGTYCRIDTEQARHFDFFTVSKAANNAVSSGVYTINAILEKVHAEPIDPAIGDVHFITRNYAVVGEYITDPSNQIATSGEGQNKGNNTGTVAGGGSNSK